MVVANSSPLQFMDMSIGVAAVATVVTSGRGAGGQVDGVEGVAGPVGGGGVRGPGHRVDGQVRPPVARGHGHRPDDRGAPVAWLTVIRAGSGVVDAVEHRPVDAEVVSEDADARCLVSHLLRRGHVARREGDLVGVPPPADRTRRRRRSRRRRGHRSRPAAPRRQPRRCRFGQERGRFARIGDRCRRGRGGRCQHRRGRHGERECGETRETPREEVAMLGKLDPAGPRAHDPNGPVTPEVRPRTTPARRPGRRWRGRRRRCRRRCAPWSRSRRAGAAG